MTETVQDLISNGAAVLQANMESAHTHTHTIRRKAYQQLLSQREFRLTYLKCFQITHVVDQNISVHRSQPQRMSIIPFSKVISRKSLLARLPCQFVECLFFISAVAKHSVFVCMNVYVRVCVCVYQRCVLSLSVCIFVGYYLGPHMKNKYVGEREREREDGK